MEPSALVEVMAGGAVDRVMLAGPAHLGKELGNHETVRRLLDMLAISPPAKVISPLEVLFRALKQRNVCPEKFPRLTIRDILNVQLLVIFAEPVDVMPERGGFEHVWPRRRLPGCCEIHSLP